MLTHPDRFWAKVDRSSPDGCWLWQGATQNRGYGMVGSGGRGRVLAHRHAYRLANGPIPDGMHICHACDNPPCCRPAHLFIGTHADNMRDAVRKGTFRAGRRSWALLTEHAVRVIRRRASYTTQRDLGKRFRVAPETIADVIHGRTWSNVL